VRILRHPDLILLALLLPVFIAAGLPLLGYAAGAGAWLLQRAIQLLANRRAKDSDDPKIVAGIAAGSMIARGWIAALTIFGVGIATDDETGLSAALVFIGVFTVYFTVNLILRPFDEAERKGTT
jgi:hypothetical protein